MLDAATVLGTCVALLLHSCFPCIVQHNIFSEGNITSVARRAISRTVQLLASVCVPGWAISPPLAPDDCHRPAPPLNPASQYLDHNLARLSKTTVLRLVVILLDTIASTFPRNILRHDNNYCASRIPSKAANLSDRIDRPPPTCIHQKATAHRRLSRPPESTPAPFFSFAAYSCASAAPFQMSQST